MTISTQCFVDLASLPYTPQGLNWLNHEADYNTLPFDQLKIEIYLCEKQKRQTLATWEDVRKELLGQDTYNANLLDYILRNQESLDSQRLIPEDWQHYRIFFWSTKYLDEKGDICVRCLAHNGNVFYGEHKSKKFIFSPKDFFAVRP